MLSAQDSATVEMIFTKLSLVYGRDFLGRWEGLDLDAVKADWVHELGGRMRNPAMLRNALTNLPPRAPNVVEFSKLLIDPKSPADDTQRYLAIKAEEAKGATRPPEFLRDLVRKLTINGGSA